VVFSDGAALLRGMLGNSEDVVAEEVVSHGISLLSHVFFHLAHHFERFLRVVVIIKIIVATSKNDHRS